MKFLIMLFWCTMTFALSVAPKMECYKTVIPDGECPLLVYYEGSTHHCTQTLNSDGYSKTCHVGSPVKSALLRRQGLFENHLSDFFHQP